MENTARERVLDRILRDELAEITNDIARLTKRADTIRATLDMPSKDRPVTLPVVTDGKKLLYVACATDRDGDFFLRHVVDKVSMRTFFDVRVTTHADLARTTIRSPDARLLVVLESVDNLSPADTERLANYAKVFGNARLVIALMVYQHKMTAAYRSDSRAMLHTTIPQLDKNRITFLPYDVQYERGKILINVTVYVGIIVSLLR